VRATAAPGASGLRPPELRGVSLEACPGRNYGPISILKTGIFLTFCTLSNATKYDDDDDDDDVDDDDVDDDDDDDSDDDDHNDDDDANDDEDDGG